MDLQLDGKRALVTGGSRGIGLAIARQLAAEGARVVIAARTPAGLDAAAAQIEAETGQRVLPIAADTTDTASVQALVAAAVAALGGLDILVNAAAQPSGPSVASKLADIADDVALADIDTKVIGYLRLARAAAPHLVQGGWGRIVNIGGLGAYRTGRPVTSLRNVAVAALTKNLADELGPQGVNVVCVHPGATRTERTDAAAQAAARGNTIGRMVDAREVADVVAFLASPRSAAINGDAIGTGGGMPGSIHYG